MAVWSGNVPATVNALNNVDVSSDINPMARPNNTTTDRVLVASVLMSTGGNTTHKPNVVDGALLAAGHGARMSSYGDFFFERIHLLPASKTYQFILSNQTIHLEVWNAYRETAQSVEAVNLVGPPGITISTPHVVPIAFAPLQSRLYDVIVGVTGSPRANNTIQFDFTGIPEPLFTIIGLRLLPFTISPDWESGVNDSQTWMTDIMTAYDDTEQRVQLRVVPSRAFDYVAKALDDREAGLLMSLLWAWQGRSYGVPLWMDAAPLLADTVAGTTVLPVDPATMTLTAGVDTVLVIADAFNWFASPIDAYDPILKTITLDTPLDRDFFAKNTQVIPVLLGRVASKLSVDRPTNVVSSANIKFDLQTVVQL